MVKELKRSLVIYIPKQLAEKLKQKSAEGNVSIAKLIAQIMEVEVFRDREKNKMEKDVKVQARIESKVLDTFYKYARRKKYSMNKLIEIAIGEL